MLNIENIINKIIHADCLDILKGLPDKCIDLVLTDPPYNASNSNISCEEKGYNSINKDWDKNFIAKPFLDLCYEKLKDNGSMIIFCSYHTLEQYLSFKKMKLQQILHWEKTNPFPAIAKVYTPNVEYIVWFVKGSPYVFNKNFAEHCILRTPICQGSERENHPSQKPLKLINKLLLVHSNEHDIVLDCFSGSGTTAVACHNLNRRFICIEKEKEYYDLSVERLKNAQAQLKLF